MLMLCRVPGFTGRSGLCSSATEQILHVRVELSRAARTTGVGEHLAVQLVEREAVPRRPPAQAGRRLRRRAAHQVQAYLQTRLVPSGPGLLQRRVHCGAGRPGARLCAAP